MALFQVTDIIDGNTFKVGAWKYGEDRGSLVRIHGYTLPPEKPYNDFAKLKLITLIKNKSVELKNVVSIEKDINGENIIRCHVYLDSIDISTYFRELFEKTT